MVTKYQNVYLPDRLLQPCQKSAWPGGTYRLLAELAERRGTDIDNCNAQIAEALKYQDDLRASESDQGGK